MSNINSLHFPSGLTVKQLKKNAKTYIKSNPSFSNMQALDFLCGKEQGFPANFNKAIEKLKSLRERIPPKDNAANIKNANLGSDGTNLQYDQNQGNRGKQLNQNQKTHKVAFQVTKGLLSAEFLKENKLRKLSFSESKKLIEKHGSDWHLKSYDIFEFNKPIKGGQSNISGALQRIHSVMTGKLKYKQTSRFWIGLTAHTDNKHPDENHEEFEYSPFIDGFS